MEKRATASFEFNLQATQTGHKAELYDTRGDVLHRFFHRPADTQSCEGSESAFS